MSTKSPHIRIEKLNPISKAKRIFYLFKPKEPIAGEEFDLSLIILNLSQKTYKNGYIVCSLEYLGTDQEFVPIQLRFQFDILKPNEKKEIKVEKITAISSGPAILYDFYLICNKKPILDPSSFINSMGTQIRLETPLIFMIASREELYQKYSVIVALWTSIVSIIISIWEPLFKFIKHLVF